MKRFLILFAIFFCANSFADTETINWYVDNQTYTTTCEIGGDIILPNTPTKYGYTFQGWALYRPIEYLKSSGTQYINTGIMVNSEYSVEVRGIFNCGSVVLGAQGATFGMSNNFVLAIACSNQGSVWGFNTTNSIAGQLSINNSNMYTLKIDKYGIYTDGVQKIWFTPGNMVVNSNSYFLLFATKASSYGWSSDAFQYVKIWGSDNTLVRDFVPVLDPTGTPCMFDKVEEKFYYNAGTGQFIAGPVINQ